MSQIDLYRIVMGDQVWTLTSADEDQEYNDELYAAVAMGRTGYESKNEMAKANVEVRLPLSHVLAINLLTSFNDQIMTLTVYTNRDGSIQVSWKGRLSSLKPGDNDLTLVFESVFTSLRRPGLRARYQKSCRHALYGRGCRLDPEDFAEAATVDDIVGSTITVPEAASQIDGYYLGGMLRAADGVLSYIINHVGDQITVQRVSYSLTAQFDLEGAGTAVTIYPGCDHTRATCNGKFSNGDNYGGFDWIPRKNPMGGSSIV